MKLDWSSLPSKIGKGGVLEELKTKIENDLPWLEYNWNHSSPDGSVCQFCNDSDWRVSFHLDATTPNAVVFCLSTSKAPSGADWKTAENGTYKTYCITGTNIAQEDNARDDEERKKSAEKLRQQNEAKKKEKVDKGAKKFVEMEVASESFGYLKKKGVEITQEMGIRKYYNYLNSKTYNVVVPLYDKDGKVSSWQYLTDKEEHPFCSFDDATKTWQPDKENGGKRYDGEKKGKFFPIGFPKTKDKDEFFATPCYICEGLATGLSIYNATGKPTVVALDAGNLKHVAPLFPYCFGVADNDNLKSGTGEKKMTEALGDKYVLIPVDGMDANDFAQEYGNESLVQFLGETLEESYRAKKEDEEWDLGGNFYLSPSDWLDPEKRKIEWIVDGLVMKSDEICCIYGDPSGGKTTLLTNLLFTLAIGGDTWGGMKLSGEARTLYFASEGVSQLMASLYGFALDNNISGADWRKLCFNFTVQDETFDLSNANDEERITRSILAMKVKPTFIVFDTLNSFFGSLDENSQKDATLVMECLKRIHRRTGAIPLFITHVAKDENKKKTVRGSSVFGGSVYLEMRVEDSPNGNKWATVSKRKGAPKDWYLEFSKREIPTGLIDNFGNDMTTITYDFVCCSKDFAFAYKKQPKKEKPKSLADVAKEDADRSFMEKLIRDNFPEHRPDEVYFLDKETLINSTMKAPQCGRETKEEKRLWKNARDLAADKWEVSDGKRHAIHRYIDRGWIKAEFDGGDLKGVFVNLYEFSPFYWETLEKEKEAKEENEKNSQKTFDF